MMLLIILGAVYTGILIFVFFRVYLNHRDRLVTRLNDLYQESLERWSRATNLLKTNRFLRRGDSGKSAIHD